MRKADIPFLIEDTVQRHASQLEEFDLLLILSGDQMISVCQAEKRDVFLLPILLKDGRHIGANGQDLHTAAGELFIVITQARQLRAAVGSHKAP